MYHETITLSLSAIIHGVFIFVQQHDICDVSMYAMVCSDAVGSRVCARYSSCVYWYVQVCMFMS